MNLFILLELVKSVNDVFIVSVFFSCYLTGHSIDYWKKHKLRGVVAILVVTAAYLIRNCSPLYLSFGSFYMLINIVTYVCLMYSISYFFFKGRDATKFLLIFLSMILVLVFDFFIYLIIQSLFGVNYFDSNQPSYAYGGIFASQFVQLIMVFLLRSKRKAPLAVQGKTGFYLLQVIVPFMTSLFFIIYPVFVEQETQDNDVRFFMVVALFAVINLVHFIVFEIYQKLEKENYENLFLVQEFAHREEYYQQMENHQKKIRAIRHDLKNQLLTLVTNDEESEKQIEKLLGDVLKEEACQFTQNSSINQLLSNKYQRAQESNIQTEFEVKVPAELKFELRDLGALIGNAIDNAIEACQRCSQERKIELKLIYFNHMLVLEIENSTAEQVSDFKTQKKKALEHGFGVKSIQAITEKYHGDLFYEAKEHSFRLELSIWEPN
ncbi:sensor histidine kinase [Candidatus Enterococcus murrayae]|uniref:GHKL domain-containing protein n=1 Tax=Candidatus Enterococcus murrayae TaxID=2815321 RepID=A0ABS3HNU9_9ENTE|nr:sensor histidine kinase [Enterococcus sp. MJM16]MBO0454560.1 GHKL domain-containing protein [Enterococcus sp. MJM16]